MLKFFKRLFCEHDWRLFQKIGSWREIDTRPPYISGRCNIDGFFCKKCGKIKLKCYGDSPKKHRIYSEMKQKLKLLQFMHK